MGRQQLHRAARFSRFRLRLANAAFKTPKKRIPLSNTLYASFETGGWPVLMKVAFFHVHASLRLAASDHSH
jgi:hypothetical protein